MKADLLEGDALKLTKQTSMLSLDLKYDCDKKDDA